METPDEILKKFANNHSYDTWPEMVTDCHDQVIIDYTIEAMTEFASLKEQQLKESLIKDLLLTVEEEKHVIKNPTDYDYRLVEDARKIYNTVQNVIKIIEGKK